MKTTGGAISVFQNSTMTTTSLPSVSFATLSCTPHAIGEIFMSKTQTTNHRGFALAVNTFFKVIKSQSPSVCCALILKGPWLI